MGFMSHRRRHVEVQPEQKWDYISLGDFKSTNCFTPFAYAFLWFSIILSIAVYAVDVFTAVQLLAFNQNASSIDVNQFISRDVSKWIFSVCIILSVVNLAYEHIRARRIMNRGSVAECFLDSLAARLESIRMGRGRGWRRFLVFAELTESKKGSEYVALFTYFSFQTWVRVLLCSGPRQVVNALTLYSVYDTEFSDESNTNFEKTFFGFFEKLGVLAQTDSRQMVILSGMLFTLVIWVFSFISLMLGAIFFIFYLWHIIPRDDGGLTGFCERKVNKRLKQIVSVKINKAMAEDERKRRKAEFKAAKKNGGDRPVTMQPTLPSLTGRFGEDKLPEMPVLKRTETMASVGVDSSRPSTPGSFEMNALGRQIPTRTGTMASSTSQFSSKVSLLGAAAAPGRSSPVPTLPSLDLNGYPSSRAPTMPNVGLNDRPLPPVRAATAASNWGYGADPNLQHMPSNVSAFRNEYSASPAPHPNDTRPPFPRPVRTATSGPNNSGLPGPYPGSRSTYDEYPNGRASPAPSVNTYHSGPRSPQGMGPDGYPMRSATNPVPPRGPYPYPPQRNMTAPIQPQHQPSESNGSLRMMPGSVQPPQHRPNASNGSFGSMRSPPAGQQQFPFHQQHPSEDWGYNDSYNQGSSINRPGTSNTQRSAPRVNQGAYGGGGGSGWNQDVERGDQGRRY